MTQAPRPSPAVAANLRVLHVNPFVALADGFVSARDCQALIALARPGLHRATAGAEPGTTQISSDRTNSAAALPLDSYPMLRPLIDKMAALVGLPAENAEPFGVLHYTGGQEFKPHPDAMHLTGGSDAVARLDASGGQRVFTTMIYLNDVPGGGATTFPRLGFSIPAKARRLLIFANTLAGSRAPTEAALHAGEPVTDGEKWAAITWWRQRRYTPPDPRPSR